MLPPFSIAFVKGWRRSLACLICCEGVKSLGIELDELTSDFKAAACVEHIGFHGWFYLLVLAHTFAKMWFYLCLFIQPLQASLAVVHGAVSKHSTCKEAVWASRGAFMWFCSVLPELLLLHGRNNASILREEVAECNELSTPSGGAGKERWGWRFQGALAYFKEHKKLKFDIYCHQLNLWQMIKGKSLLFSGVIHGLVCTTQEWASATQVARAFQLGEKESKSVAFLKSKIDRQIVSELRDAVRQRGMRCWLTHDVLASEMMNTHWSSGKTGPLMAWQAELTNLEDNNLDTRQAL